MKSNKNKKSTSDNRIIIYGRRVRYLYRRLDIFMFIKITTCLFKYIHGQDTITDPSLYIIGVGKKKQFTFPFIRRLYARFPRAWTGVFRKNSSHSWPLKRG